ncbi:MAG: ABC-2 family transporter protein [Planctomycetes bacterium]|nr:ABC-2 family transporter protein [Planctomycetota bacterium]
MRRVLSLYTGFFVQSLKARLAYRADFLSELFASLLATAAGILFVVLLFHRIPDLGGWRREEVLFLYGLSLVPYGIFNIFSINLYEFADRYIIEGRFDRLLLRPMPTLAQLLMERSRLTALQEVAVGLGVALWAGARLGLAWSAVDLLWLGVVAVSGAVILLAVFSILASLSFFFEDRIGVNAPVWNLIQFGRFPLPIFGPWLGAVLSWVIPFGFVTFYPATHFLGRSAFRTLCYATPLVAAAFALLGLAVWTLGVRGYRSTGS